MPSLFAGLAAAASTTVDAVFAEPFRLVPRVAPTGPTGRRDVNAELGLSPELPPVLFVGVFVAAGALMHAQGRAMSGNTTHAIAGESPMVDVAAADLPQRPKMDWLVVRVETGERFSVASVVAIDFGRLQIHLAELRETR